MATFTTYPENYLTYNTQQTKQLALVVEIPGLPLLTSAVIYKRVRYGDPDLVYGLPGVVYGGLRRIETAKDILYLESSSLTIGQKVEPEQGRAAISMMTLAFIDLDGYMTQVISPGVILDDILGKPVRIYLGYAQLSFPEDYFTVFRGYVTSTVSAASYISLQLSDASLKRRTQVFLTGKAKTTAVMNSVQTSITLTNTTDFYEQIIGPGGGYDSSVKTYLKIEDEYLQYPAGPISALTVAGLVRGSRGTAAVAHAADADVQTCIELTGNAVDLILKISMSGWAGPYLSNLPLYAIKSTGLVALGEQPTAVVLSLDKDAVEDYGLTIGDWITVSGSSFGNNGTFQVTDIGDWDDLKNRVIYTTATFNSEPSPTSAVISIRSQFDTLPIQCGLKLAGHEVDVATHLEIRNDFLSQDTFQFFIQSVQTGKSWMEQELYLPEGAYPVTRYGKISMNLTRPPLPGQTLAVLDKDSVIDPNSISVTRATNNRRFFNEVRYDFDQNDKGVYFSTLRLIDTNSLNKIGISSAIPVKSSGLKSTQSGALIANRRGRFLLTRYKNGAYEIPVKLNWEKGSLVETGDVVVLKDEGNLQISNLENGERDIGVKLFEVIDRKVDIKSGQVSLQLLSNTGFDITDRYATVSPSSLLGSGSTSSEIVITNSFGNVTRGKEQRKWTDYVGLPVVVRSANYSVMEETIFTGVSPLNDHTLLLSPPLSFTPPAGYILEITDYPTSIDPSTNELYKQVHCFLSPVCTVVSGISNTQFTVSGGDALKILPGFPLTIHNSSYSILSNEVIVDTVVSNTVTVTTSLGFTPTAGQTIDLLGFADGKASYRII